MRTFFIFLLAAIGVFVVDQGLKALFLNGYYREGSCIDLVLHLNKGVAFSMFASLGAYLKWIQLGLIAGILFYILHYGYVRTYPFALGLLIGGALGNLYDRFIHGAVVDYVAWHCGFHFAVFNFADVMIDFGVALILFMGYLSTKKGGV